MLLVAYDAAGRPDGAVRALLANVSPDRRDSSGFINMNWDEPVSQVAAAADADAVRYASSQLVDQSVAIDF